MVAIIHPRLSPTSHNAYELLRHYFSTKILSLWRYEPRAISPITAISLLQQNYERSSYETIHIVTMLFDPSSCFHDMKHHYIKSCWIRRVEPWSFRTIYINCQFNKQALSNIWLSIIENCNLLKYERNTLKTL